MRKFEHGDHDCSVICTDLGDALDAGLLRPHDGNLRGFSAFAVGRAAYAFCSSCGHFAWSATETGCAEYGVDYDEADDEKLEGMAIRGFKDAASDSCAVQRNTELVREVMTS